jgi:D-alanyl-D-alanine dipeptidase
VDLASINKRIRLDIKYATRDNFTHQKLYPTARCFLQRAVALKLDNIQRELEKKGLGLKIFDGYRPHSVQYKMWSAAPNKNYVADPKKGSMHNRGAAVDLTLVDLKTGKELEMPTPFDELTKRAHRKYTQGISQCALKNCAQLEQIMVKYGFIPLSTEWWHFNDKEWSKYPLLDISFDQLCS